MARIRIIRSTVCNGEPREAGDVIEVDEREAAFLVQIGKAEIVPEAESASRRPRRSRAVIKPAREAAN
jgi:hypothetical protein